MQKYSVKIHSNRDGKMKLNILYEDEVMLACVKPFGIPSQGDKSNDEDMVTLLKNYLFDNSDSDDEPYLAVIHRLDRPVGGVMIFAKTPEAAAKLSDEMQDGNIIKYYQAILTGELPDDCGGLRIIWLRIPRPTLQELPEKAIRERRRRGFLMRCLMCLRQMRACSHMF